MSQFLAFVYGLLVLLTVGSAGLAQDTAVTGSPDDQEDPSPRLVWTELRIVDRRAQIQSLPADPLEYITSNVISSKYYYELTPAHWIAIASDYADGVAFWSDANHKRIMKGGLREGATASPVFDGTSSTVDGIAVDWLANNVYWADAAYNWIIVADYDITRFKIVIDDGLDKPRGLAVHPQLGYLFWTDWGTRQTIERSTLAGENRTVLVDDNIYFPNGITIDYTTDKIYWTDADPAGSRVEVCSLDGTNRTTVYSHPADKGHFFDVAVFQNYIFVTDWYNGIRCIFKDSGEHYFALNVGGRPFGLTLHGDGILPGTSSPCDAKPCDHLCISDPDGYKCVCQDGFDLIDNHTCYRMATYLAKPQIILAAQNSICYFPSNFPDISIPSDYQRNCILTNRSHVVALDVDVRSKTMFFSDFVHKTIQSVRLMDGSVVKPVIGGVGSVEGMAIDWLAQNLYWTDFQLNHIGISRYDGSNRRILLEDHVLNPRSIVIHAGLRIMFWTEFGTSNHIEQASLDGSNRTIILNSVGGLNGLAIDFEDNRLYYADRESGSIQHVDFHGNGRTLLYTRSGAEFFDIDIHKDYLLWTEWNTFNGLHAINRENRRVIQSYSIKNESTYGIRVYSDDRQPDYDNVCIDNGGCQHLCLPVEAGGMRCECGTGYQLHSDGHTCIAEILYDDFLLASDTYLHSIFQINLTDPNFGYAALQLDTRMVDNPVALAYDPMVGQVYWSDVIQKTIRRAFIFNGTQDILFTNQHIETSDGLTIDPTSRLLFWTDVGLPSIQVAHLDGSNRKSIVLSDIEKPRAIVADPGQGLLYWSDWGTLPKIERAFMDGTNRTVLVNTNLGWPNGLALDYKANKLYWCDASSHLIEVLNLHTMQRDVLLDLGQDSHPFSIVIHGPYIYWSDWRQKNLMRADKDTGANNGTVGPAAFVRLNGLYAYSTRDHAPFSNACVSGLENGGCSTLCLPTPNGRVCACRDGATLDQDGVSCSGTIQCTHVLNHGSLQSDCQRVPGSTCNVECQSGYQPSVSRIRCGHDGTWNAETDSVCELVRCPALSVPSHASVVACLGPHVYGNQCRFHCQTGYMQVDGEEQVLCMEDGQWSGNLLTCQVVICPPLPAHPTGVYSPPECSTTTSQYNTTCSVMCLEGYRLLGVASRMCQADAQWTDGERASTCVDVTAPTFDDCPSDMNFIAKSGQIVANATWSEPQAVDNSGEDATITSSVDSPLLLGEGSRMVMYYAQDGEGNTGVCTFIVTVNVLYCDMLGIPFNGYFEHCTHHLGSVCAIRCNNGFAVRGSPHRHCELDASRVKVWSGEPAHCQLIECDEPSTMQSVLKADCTPPYYFRAGCSYTCAPGYERTKGSEHRICQDDNQWSGLTLECRRRTCPQFVLSDHAKVNPVACRENQNFYQRQCVLSCDEGYRLVGIPLHTCMENGQWSDADDAHFCEDIAAPHFNGTCPEDFGVTAPRGKTEAVVTWTLPVVMDNEGNELTVTSSRQPGVTLLEGLHAILIQATDKAGNQGTCRFVVTVHVVHCPLHAFPHFGDFRGESCMNFFGAQCNFRCLVGYHLRGSENRTCEWNGQNGEAAQWTGKKPVCGVVMCAMFDFPEGTTIEGCDSKARSLPYGSTCYTMCGVGKRPVPGGNNGQRMCRDTGTWSGENIKCENVTCPVLPSLRYGAIQCNNDPPQFPTICDYRCHEGFSLRGVTTTTCLASGNWSRTDRPICQDVSAPEFLPDCPQIVMNIVPEPCANGSIVSYEWPTAKDNSGEVNVTGGEDDVMGSCWPVGVYERSFTARDPSGNSAECLLIVNILRIQCQQIPEIAQASVVSQTCGNQGGSRAEFACEDGTQLIGARYLTCGQDGQWNETLPLCSAVYCSPLSAPRFGTISPPQCSSGAVNYLTWCEMECNSGFGLSGQGLAICQQNGQWTNDITNSICMDFTPPVFTECPESQYHVLAIGEATVQVFVETPTATDNSGIEPVIEAPSAGDQVLGPGTHFFPTTATDETGNVARCITEILVKDLEPPTILYCPNATTIRTSTLPVSPKWEEPTVDDNIGIKDIYSDKVNGAPVYQWGLFVVRYIARDRADNTNECRIEIEIVDDSPCQPLEAPPNGTLACEDDNHCTVHCKQGYMFLTQPSEDALVCLNSGLWSNALLDQHTVPYLPACTKRDERSYRRWERKDKYVFSLNHLTGGCEEHTEDIRTKFVALFSRLAFPLCQVNSEYLCKLENIVVNCGDITEESGQRRRPRREAEFDVNVDLLPRLVVESFRNNTSDINSSPPFLNTPADDMFGDGNVTFDLDRGGKAVLIRNSSDTGRVELFCADGMMVYGMGCVKCPKGTRYKLSQRKCEPCGIATYQDQEGQLTCQVCRSGRTTIGTGAFDQSHCQKMCPPGQFSFWGVLPCQLCPRGSYQTGTGRHACEPCPDGMMTRVMGATAMSLCTSNFQTPKIPDQSDTTTVLQTTPAVVQTTQQSGTTGKVDIGVITRNPKDGGNDDDNNTQPRSSVPVTAIVIAVVVLLAVLTVFVVGVGCIVQRRRKRKGGESYFRPRPISWAGSTRGIISSEENDDDTDGMDLLAISNPVFGMMEGDSCISPLGTTNFSTFLDDNAPPLFDDPTDIPKLDPPPKKK